MGVQSDENRRKEFEQGSLLTYVIAGVIFTVLFVGGLILLVSVIVWNNKKAQADAWAFLVFIYSDADDLKLCLMLINISLRPLNKLVAEISSLVISLMRKNAIAKKLRIEGNNSKYSDLSTPLKPI